MVTFRTSKSWMLLFCVLVSVIQSAISTLGDLQGLQEDEKVVRNAHAYTDENIATTHEKRQRRPWDNPGCHRLGHSRLVEIPGCVAFRVKTNACRGFCQSFTIPSSPLTLKNNPNHLLTSRAECCSIVETHDVHVTVRCITGFQRFTFKSARRCQCSVCRKY